MTEPAENHRHSRIRILSGVGATPRKPGHGILIAIVAVIVVVASSSPESCRA